MNTFEAILARRSIRKFRAEQIPAEARDKILLAGECAPIGRGLYQSIFISVVQDQAVLNHIRQIGYRRFNAADVLYGAPTLIVVSSSGDPLLENIEYANAACIIENMMLAATDIGIGSVYIWGAVTAFREDMEICQALKLPDGFRPISAVALGYVEGSPEKRKGLFKIPYQII